METLEKKRLKKPTKIEEMTKEQIRQAIIKKRQCNAKAQFIVESLLEKCVNEDFFLKSLFDINQSHFDDVIEERSILHLCGYPLCQRTLSAKDIPKQKYRISVKTNKVYDITARKSFCSNICYKSAMHIKKQMLTSPLWFRDYEEIPKFCLLPLDSSGSLGQEIDLSLTEKIDFKSETTPFASVNDFSNATLHEINVYQNKNNNNQNVQVNPNDADLLNIDSDLQKVSQKVEKLNINQNNITTEVNTTKKSAPNPLNIVGDIIEKPEKKIDPILLNSPANTSSVLTDDLNTSIKKQIPQKKQPSINIIMIEVEKCLAEWFTIDTLIYLFGEDKLKQLVADKGQCIKDYLNNYSKSIFYTSNSYDQYQTLCRKLNMLELEDRRYDAQTLSRETKPLPDYSILKEESKKMQLKVKAFFAGETVVPEVEHVETDLINEDENTTQLPLVDKNAQNALRRRIVCQHLNKVLPDLLKSLGLLTLTISSDIRLLVNTFKLKANNIMFKPIQWTLIAIVFIRLLSIRDKRLEYLLQQPTAFRHMQLLLLSYKQDGGYLDRLISWLTDIDRLLDVNDTQLTIE
ncbi:putative RNA polymerase II subunit B1 CTD phosphatase RPAP2 [Vanessa atalanta]|uniref:putative RNA polymerase II subunit B1 CTD phosphatase RPAP2 n=1 Tax=Vanessa atalanta TaxID=42275 RepID=UPI001FCD1B7E|nr:putative RNA polymerase II subunit B1 CTD phosphatase RPAP2 [Vanessa atalanta]